MNDVNMPVEVQDVLSRLEFFAQQGRNVKPCIKQRTFVDADTWTGWLFRRVFRESSDGTIRELKSMMKDYGNCVERFPSFRPLMTETLERASKGIDNLNGSYHDKPDVIADLRVIKAMIEMFLSKPTSEPIAIRMSAVDDVKSYSAPVTSTLGVHLPPDRSSSPSGSPRSSPSASEHGF